MKFIIKKIKLFGSVVFVLIISVTTLSLLLSLVIKKIPQQRLPVFDPTPTLVPQTTPHSILHTTVIDKQTNTSIIPDISFTFSAPFSTDDKANTKISTNPPIPGILVWSPNNYAVTLSPNQKLQSGQQYTARITYPNGTYAWSFTTTAQTTVTTDEQGKLQGLDDLQFANTQKNLLVAYPWLNQLPLTNPHYYVYFDVFKKSFFVDIYSPTTSTLYNQAQIEIKNALTTLVPDLSKYPIVWTAKP